MASDAIRREKMNVKLAIAMVFIAACAHGERAAAQTTYKCGETYSQQPCSGGSALQSVDARTEAQRVQAGAAAKRDAKLADAMEKERLKQEAQAAPANILPRPDTTEAPQNRPATAKPKKPEVFVAVVPRKPGEKAPKKKKKSGKRSA
jgi:hypothetical protein